jgi:aryl-alcohol dehydrogenase-like predicted oxidoreductase
MEQRKLGTQGLVVGAIGLGCMSMTPTSSASGSPPMPDETESIATIHHALNCGVTLLDTAEAYGPYKNEELIGKAIRGMRKNIIIATKFGIRGGLNGTPANAKRVAEESLKRLNTDVIDLYYLHRKDPNVPIEETVGAMKELIEEGKVRYLGLSEVGHETLRRAHKIHPITALQSEYSLWERGVEKSILPVLRELGIGFVPFSPLGRGFLIGAFKSIHELPQGDFRYNVPRFHDEHAAANLKIVEIVKMIAARHSSTPAQIALAWVLAQGDDMVPIPGTKHRKYLDDNLGALHIHLSIEDFAELNKLSSMVSGERYLPHLMQMVEH